MTKAVAYRFLSRFGRREIRYPELVSVEAGISLSSGPFAMTLVELY